MRALMELLFTKLFYDPILWIATLVHCCRRSLRSHTPMDKDFLKTYFLQRLGFFEPFGLSEGKPVIWIHAVSLGEVHAAKIIVREARIVFPGSQIVFSCITPDGFKAAQDSRELDQVFFYPADVSSLARRLLHTIKPQFLIIVEGDYWFNLVREASRAQVPLFSINGKLSSRSFRNYSWFPWYTRQVFKGFAKLYLQSPVYYQRFSDLKVDKQRLSVSGNIKLDIRIKQLEGKDREAFRQQLFLRANAKYVAFCNIHPGEREYLFEAIRKLRQISEDIQFILVPRHPAKFSDPWSAIPNDQKDSVAVVTNEGNREEKDIIWINKLGVVDSVYSVVDVAFVGGTFVDVGGHNIVQPNLFGIPVVYGPDISSQPELHSVVQKYGSGFQVGSAQELQETICRLLFDQEESNAVRSRCQQLTNDCRGMTMRILNDMKTGMRPFRPESSP